MLRREWRMRDAKTYKMLPCRYSLLSLSLLCILCLTSLDPADAPHILTYMYRFGPILMGTCLLICLAAEMPALRVCFRSTDESVETIAFGMLFAMLAAPSSVVSKRLQRLLGSFQRTLLGVCNNIVVAIVSVGIINGGAGVTALSIVGSCIVFLSPGVQFIDFEGLMKRAKVNPIVRRVQGMWYP
jgi:hypothetical protein